MRIFSGIGVIMMLSASATAACAADKPNQPPKAPETLQVSIAKPNGCSSAVKTFVAEVANDDDERVRGLSGRTRALKPNEAMLFVFQSASFRAFWMKDTLIPLDIAFFDNEGRLIATHHMPVEADPGYPKKHYGSNGMARWVVEGAPGSLAGFKPDEGWILCINGKPAAGS